MRHSASGTRAHTLIPRFTLYRTLRRIAGPVLAYRLSFGGRAA
ncbi:hypothetical protein [Thauera aromatica]|uniref:Uncharacterized protein n=1 Tax=Thauera aromatica K172 TaxID=44139 RepID=A0A2R4BQI1_THAAR|nr:hypothetical protein [Thauera aromatica]AVR89540.1 hypothetical protein Tharo_2652 [Thauera aromatica K172]